MKKLSHRSPDIAPGVEKVSSKLVEQVLAVRLSHYAGMIVDFALLQDHKENWLKHRTKISAGTEPLENLIDNDPFCVNLAMILLSNGFRLDDLVGFHSPSDPNGGIKIAEYFNFYGFVFPEFSKEETDRLLINVGKAMINATLGKHFENR